MNEPINPELYGHLDDSAPESVRPELYGHEETWNDILHQQASANINAASGVNPDQAAKAADLSQKTGVPQPAIAADLDTYTQIHNTRENREFLQSNPKLMAWLAANPLHAQVASDDIPNLTFMEKLMGSLGTGSGSAIRQNELGRAGGELQARTLAGMDAGNVKKEITGLQNKEEDVPQFHSGFKMAQDFAKLVVGQLDSVVSGLPEAAAGAGLGATAGGVGAIPGAIGGEVMGWKLDQSRIAAGQAYLQMGNIVNHEGQPLSENSKLLATAMVGAGTYALFSVGGKQLSSMSGDIVSKMSTEAAIQAVTRPTIAGMLKDTGMTLGKSALMFTAFNGASTVLNQVGVESAKLTSDGEFDTALNSPEVRQQYVGEIADSMEQGLKLGLLLGGLGSLAGLKGDISRVYDAKQNAAALTNLMDGAEKSKLHSRSMQLFSNFMNSQTDGTPAKNMYIPAEKIAALYQEYGMQPHDKDTLFGFVPNIKEQLAEAAHTNGDVVIPTSDFITHLAGSDVGKRMIPDTRMTPDGMSLNEAAEFQKRATELQKEYGKNAPISDEGKKVYDDVFKQVKTAGYSDADAKVYAGLYAARYATRAERKGTAATEEYSRVPLDIKNEAEKSIPAAGGEEKVTPSYLSMEESNALHQTQWHKGFKVSPIHPEAMEALKKFNLATQAAREKYDNATGVDKDITTLPLAKAEFAKSTAQAQKEYAEVLRKNTAEHSTLHQSAEDPLYNRVMADAKERGATSISNLERMGINRIRAERLIDRMEREGYIEKSIRTEEGKVNRNPNYTTENIRGKYENGPGQYHTTDKMNTANILYQSAKARDVFYSQLRKSIDVIPAKVFSSGKSVSDWLNANSGKLSIKKDELYWTGIDDWLKTQGKVNKEDVLNYLDKNGVQVKETTLGQGKADIRPQDGGYAIYDNGKFIEWYETKAEADANISTLGKVGGTPETKFASYQLPGGENYKELLLTLPAKTPEFELRSIAQMKEFLAQNKSIDDSLNGLSDVEKLKQLNKIRAKEGSTPTFKSAHFDQPNVVAHIRFNERMDAEGKKVLFLEELQSDWGQKGKKEGFRVESDTIKSLPDDYEVVKDEHGALFGREEYYVAKKGTKAIIFNSMSATKDGAISSFISNYNEAHWSPAVKKPPSAPFVTDTKAWTALALKRMIRYAAENGFDKVAWTTGEQQAARYDLSKQVGEVHYNKTRETLTAYDHSGSAVISKDNIKVSDLPDLIGKDVAKKLIENGKEKVTVKGAEEQESYRLKGQDLKVGGEGMKGYYDQIVPQVANDILKKVGGGKVETVGIGDPEAAKYSIILDNGKEVHTTDSYMNAQAVAKDFAGSSVRENPMHTQQQGFTITPELRAKVTTEGQPLFQEGEHYRAGITFGEAKNQINLFRDANMSSLAHESGHLWLKELSEDSAHSPEIAKDFDTALKYMGWDKGADAWNKASLDEQREYHEKFARGFENYLMEGKAPSAALRNVFNKLKGWLVKIYESAKNLNAPINEEIRGVFDRLLATDSEIQNAHNAIGDRSFFKQTGIGKTEFEAYSKAIEQANAEAHDKLLNKAMEDIRKRNSKEYKDQRQAVSEQVAEEVDARPDMQAFKFLRDGTGKALSLPGMEPFKLDEDAANRIAWGNRQPDAPIARQLPKNITAKDGVHPDEAAEILGFRSGADLVKAMQKLELDRQAKMSETGRNDSVRQVQIDTETDRRMDEKYPQQTPEQIQQEALDAVHNQERDKVLGIEARVLARMAGKAQIDVEDIRGWAKQQIAQKNVADATDVRTYSLGEQKAANLASKALLAGKYDEALKFKRQQILNNELYKEAQAARDEVNRATKLFTRLTDKKTFKGVDQEYTDQIHDLLGRFGFDSGRGEELQRTKSATLEDFVNHKSEMYGLELAVDPALYNLAGKPLKEMSMPEFKALNDAVRSMYQLGKDEKLIDVGGQKVEFDGVIEQMVNAIRSLGERPKSEFFDPADAGAWAAKKEKLFGTLRSIDASLLKPEALFDWIDKSDPFGIMNTAVFRRLKDAQHNEDLWHKDSAAQIKQLVKEMPDGWEKSLRKDILEDEKLINPETNLPAKFTRQRVISMALNWGNEGNRKKLADGYQWDQVSIKSFLDKNLSKEEWKFVQGVWDMFAKHTDELDALQKRVTGVGLNLVEANSFDTPHGRMAGGYYPIVYDSTKSDRMGQIAEKNNTEALFPTNYTRATTPKGNTISRVEGVKRPIELSLDIVPWKIGQTLHDLAFREALMDSDRLLSNKDVKSAMKDVFGPEYANMLRPWLKYVANAKNIDDRAISWMDKAVDAARANTVIVGIGFRATTLFKHTMTALSNSIGELGPQWMMKGTKEFYGPGMSEKWDFIQQKSPEMAFRLNAYDKDLTAQYEHLLKDSTYTAFQKNAQYFGHIAISYFDLGSAAPTWLGAYRKGLSEGMEDKDAIYYADKTVRNAHGAQGITDTAAIQHATGIAKLTNMFYGFFNHIYNRQRTMFIQGAQGIRDVKGGEFKAAGKNFAGVLGKSFYYITVPALVEAMATSHGPNEDKDESWGGWAAKAIASEIPAGIPILRDIAKAAIEGRGYEMSPIAKLVDTMIESGKDIEKMAAGEETTKAGQHLATAAGYIFGLPTAAPFTAGKFLWDYNNGDVDPQGVNEWINGLTKGKTQ